MRKLLVVVAAAACGGSSKPRPLPATIASSAKPEPVSSDPEEGGQVASAPPPAAAAGPAIASDPEEGGQVASSGVTGGTGAGAGAPRPSDTRPGAAAQLKPGEPTVSGDIDRSMIKRIVKTHANQIRYCYEKVLQQNPSAQGKVTVTFTIEKDGTVSAAKAEGVDDNLDRCLEGRFRTFEFPKPPAPATIVYPFAFAQQ